MKTLRLYQKPPVKSRQSKAECHRDRSGQMLIQALVLTALAVGFIAVLSVISLNTLTSISRSVHREQAFQIADAGIEYYRWHLAHDPDDFQDGTGGPGPYVHSYFDTEGNRIGQFSLDITPPPVGSTVVVIRSTASVDADLSIVRIIESSLAITTWAQFAVVANDDIWFGLGTEIFGLVHSNGGIRFDGFAHNLVTSSETDYNDPDHSGPDEFGVHTHVSPVDPLPPAAVPDRPDVFAAGRLFPVPAEDFDGIGANLAQIKADAQAGGSYFSDSGDEGYDVVLHTNDTYTVSIVDTLMPKPSACSNQVADPDWGIWSVDTTTPVGTFPLPANGVIFFEDDVWVSGQIDSARVTIGAARFPDNPSRRKTITVNEDLLYTNYNGTDVIGLLAQDDITVGLYSEDDLRIDAAVVAQNGRVGRYYYRAPNGSQQYCGPEALRTKLTIFGAIATNERYGFSWSCGGVFCSGYASRNILYDSNLLINPPPSWPVSGESYEVISWREIF